MSRRASRDQVMSVAVGLSELLLHARLDHPRRVQGCPECSCIDAEVRMGQARRARDHQKGGAQ